MGRPFVDTRLIDLCAGMLQDVSLPYELAKVQNGNAELRGHILAYNDEFVWRKLKSERPAVAKSRLRIRCIRCGAVASLREWYVASSLPEEKADDLHYRLSFTSEIENLAWLKPCGGDQAAVQIIAQLAEEEYDYRKAIAADA